MSFIDEFNAIAELAAVPKLSKRTIINVDYIESEHEITVWLKRAVKQKEFAGVNEDGFRWVMVHNGIRPTLNNKPF